MKQMKRIWAFLLVGVLLTGMLFAGGLTVTADADGDYTYTVANGEATITGYTGTGGSVSIPDTLGGFPVRTIGTRAFEKSDLTDVVVPGSVRTVGEYAFYSCASLVRVTLSEGVEQLEHYAFYEDELLASISVPSTLKAVGGNTMTGTVWLEAKPEDALVLLGSFVYSYKGKLPIGTTLTLPNGVIGIAGGAFSGQSGVQTIDIPSSVKSIGSSAFWRCYSLTGVTIPSGVTELAYGTFLDCIRLQNVTLPAGLKSIGDSVFYGCTSLQKIDFPDSLTTIEGGAFYQCISLSEVTVPSGVTAVGAAFQECTSLKKVILNGTLTEIAASTFSGCTALADINIPATVTYIGASAFSDCTSLARISVPDSVCRIGSSAFQGTAWLNAQTAGSVYAGRVFYSYKDAMPADTALELLPGTRGLADRALVNQKNLKSLSIPDSVTYIPTNALTDCSALLEIHVAADNATFCSEGGVLFSKDKTALLKYPTGNTNTQYAIPGSVRVISEEAFYQNKSLTDITIADDVNIGKRAFCHCDGLITVTIGKNATIQEAAFSWCPMLKSVIVNSGVIEKEAFSYCSVLEKAVLGIGVTDVGERAFGSCSKLAEIYLPHTVTGIGAFAFDNCDSLTSVSLPGSIKTIGEQAFSYCDKLAVFSAGDGVTMLSNQMFRDCRALRSVVLPESVSSIAYNAFSGCREYTIYGIGGGTIETYATGKSIPFAAMTERTLTDSATGIKVSGIMPTENTLQVQPISGGEKYLLVQRALGDKVTDFGLLDLTLLLDSLPVQPTGTLTVSAPVPADKAQSKLGAYYISEAGDLKELPLKVENNCAVFTVSHFSLYAVGIQTGGGFETGDVDRNSIKDMRDARLLFQYAAGVAELDAEQLMLGDVTGRGQTDMIDARALFQQVSGS